MEQLKSKIQNHIQVVKERIEWVKNEESTKTSLILPFFSLLGYDVHNPKEFRPEFTADYNEVRPAEKVDYAIFINDKPIMFVETKSVNEKIGKHTGQISRYFQAEKNVKIAVITNGLEYFFYAGIDAPNIMDNEPFLILDLSQMPSDHTISRLENFRKETFNPDRIIDVAEKLKFNCKITSYLKKQRNKETIDPEFIKTILSGNVSEKGGEEVLIFSGKKTSNVIERFSSIVADTFDKYIKDEIDSYIFGVQNKREEEEKLKIEEEKRLEEEKNSSSGVVTTQSETDASLIVKAIAQDVIENVERVQFKDYKGFSKMYLDAIRSDIVRFHFNNEAEKQIEICNVAGGVEWIKINNVLEIYKYREKIITSIKNLIAGNQNC